MFDGIIHVWIANGDDMRRNGGRGRDSTRRGLLGMMAGTAIWRLAGGPAAAGDAAGPADAPDLAPATALDATIAFTGHSMIATIFPIGTPPQPEGTDFPSLWPGETHLDFIGWSSNAQRWDADGYARRGDYDRLVMSELGHPVHGLPHPASDLGRQNLQYLYWFAMTAIGKGAEPVLYMPWSPRNADLDREGQQVFHYERAWLEAHTGHRIWIIPAGQFARAARDLYGDDDALFTDDVHWRADGPVPAGLAYLTYQFFARQRVPNPPRLPAMADLAWQVLQDYRWAGFGGRGEVPALKIDDPLPEPAPLPAP